MAINRWAKPYQYEAIGIRNGGAQPNIWTATPDGKQIGNWPMAK
jgi:hypothetical protein